MLKIQSFAKTVSDVFLRKNKRFQPKLYEMIYF